MRRLFTWHRAFLCLLLVVLASIAAVAQDYGDDEEGASRIAVLSLYLQQDGTARVNFYSPAALDRMPDLREALGTVLHCNSAAFHGPEYPADSIKDPERREQIRRAERQAALHQLTSVCPSPVKHERLQSTMDLALAPVLGAMKENHFDGLSVSIFSSDLPNVRTREGSARLNGITRFGMLAFQIPVSESKASVRLIWGYETSDVALPLAAAAAFIIFPSAIILWMRFRALHLHTTDRAGAWFSYIRTQHLCLTGALLIWIGGGYSTRNLLSAVLSAMWGAHSLRVAIVSLMYVFIPPVTVLIVSVLASYRVLVEVRQVSWSFRDFLQLQFAQVGIVMFPVLGIYGGISLIGSSPLLAIVTIVLSILSLPVAVHLRRKLTGTYPEPVTSGEFHDRIFLLARRAGVALKSIFVLPSGKLPVANAFAAGNGVVMVTDYVLQKLNRREVEAVTAHEIGHLQYKHPQKLGAAFVGVILIPMFVRSLFPAIIDMALLVLPGRTHWSFWGKEDAFLNPTLDFVIAGICLIGFYAISRRFERIADARSVTLTDDPEALITSFVKLSVLNLTPMQWGRASGALVTHPSTLKRVRRIAQVGNVSEQRLQELLAEPQLDGAQQTTIELFPSPLSTSARVYPAHQQLQRANINLLILIAISTAIPTLFAYLAATYSHSEFLLLILGVVATFGLYIPAVRWRIVAGRGALRKRFIAYLNKLYPALDLSNAWVIGYSPDAWPRFYYVQSHWDTGLLVPTREGVMYLGDQAKFLLPYSAIQELVFDQGISSWWKFRRSYIRWTAGESRGVMNLLSLEPCSAWSIEAGNRRLHEALENWRKAADSFASVPEECGSLALPEPVQLKSKTPNEAYPLKAVTKIVLLAAVAGVFVGNGTLTLWPMLYVPAVVFFLRFVESLPYRRYKDRPLSADWTSSPRAVENRASTQSTN
jgi:Zn-dependent protease with chaperone function